MELLLEMPCAISDSAKCIYSEMKISKSRKRTALLEIYEIGCLKRNYRGTTQLRLLILLRQTLEKRLSEGFSMVFASWSPWIYRIKGNYLMTIV